MVYACYNATGHRDLTWKLSHAPNKSMTQEHLSIVKERRRGRKTDEREQIKLTSSFSSNCISINIVIVIITIISIVIVIIITVIGH